MKVHAESVPTGLCLLRLRGESLLEQVSGVGVGPGKAGQKQHLLRWVQLQLPCSSALEQVTTECPLPSTSERDHSDKHTGEDLPGK